MKEIKKREERIEQKEYVFRTMCDICSNEIKNGIWENNEIELNATIGSSYYVIDSCKDCFLNKIQPLIEKELNCNFREIDNEDRYRLHE